jgi:hypothetical protein
MKFLISFFLISFLAFCQKSDKTHLSKKSTRDNIPNLKIDPIKTHQFASINSIDSITDSDNYFRDYKIDSIFIKKLNFNGIYLSCFKAVVGKEIYQYLKGIDSTEYESIMKIHTQHELLIEGNKYSFNATGSMGCRSIPESTLVSIGSKLYSLYSDHNLVGRLIILKSITPKSE